MTEKEVGRVWREAEEVPQQLSNHSRSGGCHVEKSQSTAALGEHGDGFVGEETVRERSLPFSSLGRTDQTIDCLLNSDQVGGEGW